MCPDTGIKAYALNDCFAVQPLYFSIGVKFIEIADTQSKIGIGKKFDCLRLFHAHEKRVDVFLGSPFLQEDGKCPGSFLQHIDIRDRPDRPVFLRKLRTVNYLRTAYNDATRIEVVIKSLAFAKKFR